MVVKELIIKNKSGIHARPASVFVQTCSKFKSSIYLEKNEKKLNSKSIISVLSGGISQGDKIKLIIDGEDEISAVKILAELIESGFGEEH